MTVDIISPTGITNSIPRPKSPRRPDYRGDRNHRVKNNSSSGGAITRIQQSIGRSPSPFVASEAFHKAHEGARNGPKIRRRPHEEIGRFAGPTKGSRSEMQEPRLCVSTTDMKDLMGLNKNSASACVSHSVDKSKEYVVRYGPAATENLTQCGTATAHGAVEVAVVASDLYRQECKTNNRGDDSMFFTNPQDFTKESNSMVDTVSSTTDEVKTPSKEQRNDSVNRGRQSDSQQPFRSPRSMRFPEAIHILKDPAVDLDMSPPRVDRVNTSQVWPEVLQEPQAPLGMQDHTNLRETRLHLFRSSKGDGTEQESRLARALEDLNRQDKLIGMLQMQLKQTTETLEVTNNELKETRSLAQKRQFTATEIRARAVQERKKIEEMLQKETQTNRRLQGVISQLQADASGLKLALRNARNDGTRKVREREAPDPSAALAAQTPAPQVIALRAEIVDLRSQLAEARAAKLEDSSSLNSFGELEQMRVKMKEAEAELEQLRENDRKVRHNEKLLREKLERADLLSKETKSKLEEKLKAVAASESAAKADLVKTKANLNRLERERSHKRLKSSAEIDRVNKQVSKSKEETAKLKRQLEEEQKTSKSELQRLKGELANFKQKLSLGNQESLLKSTEYIKERRKLQKDLSAQSQKMKSLEEKVDSQKNTIAQLETKLSNQSQLNRDRTASGKQELQDVIQSKKSVESVLRAELKTQKNLLQKANEATKKFQSQGAAHESEVQKLKKEIAMLKTSDAAGESAATLATAAVTEAKLLWEIDELKKKVAEMNDSKKAANATDNAREQAFLNDICVLKASLSEAEDRFKEEKFRAEEERRISREREAERVAEIEGLRQENERVSLMESTLTAQIDALKAKIEGSILQDSRREPPQSSLVPNNSLPDRLWVTPEGKSREGRELPEKVVRLRKELALARARLAAAREDSRTLAPPVSPDRSVGSCSSWVPPILKGNVAQGNPKEEERSEPAQVANVRQQGSEPRLPIDSKEQEQQGTADNSSARTIAVSDLERQLRETSKRLSDANSKLKGLAKASDEVIAKHVKPVEANDQADTLLTVIRLDPSDQSSGSDRIDEVRASMSGSIEVTERRFFDL